MEFPRAATDLTTSRRTVLMAGAGGAGAALLAACSSGGGGSTGPRTHARKPAGGGKPAETALATLADITVGHAVPVTLPDGAPAVIARPTSVSVVCFSAICTHMGCVVEPAGNELVCPCHGSQFNAMTGQVLSGPAQRPLPQIPVTVTDGKVVTA